MDEQTLAKFEERYIPEPNSGCWIWTGAITSKNYGDFSIRGKSYRAHRVSYKIAFGKIPKGLVLDHLCKNTFCVNPTHLEAVTQGVNRERGSLGRFKFSCDAGHPRSPENSYIKSNGITICRVCRRLRNKEWKLRRKRKNGR